MRSGDRAWLPWAALGLMLFVSAALIFWTGRGTVFKGDDWDLLLYRQGFSSDVFLFPHSEHLVALQVLVLKLIGAVAGLHYAAYRAALVAVDLAVAGLFFAFARQRIGDWLGLAATAPLLFLGAASDSLIWPTMIGAMSSLACGIGALMLLERSSTAAKAGCCALLLAAIGFESNGLFFMIAVAIWLTLDRRWRDLWIAAIPAIAYFAWHSGHGSSQLSGGNLADSPGFILDLALAGFSTLSGVGTSAGHPKAIGTIVLLALAAGVAWLLLNARPRLGARTLAIASLPFAYWTAIALARAEGGDPFASRYAYASVLFILMLLVELLRDTRVRQLFAGWRSVVLLAGLGVSIAANLHLLFQAGDYQRYVSQFVRGRAGAIELTRRTIDQNVLVPPLQNMGNMRAGWYLNIVDRFDESPIGRPDISALIDVARMDADRVLSIGAHAGLYPVGPARAAGDPPTPERPNSNLRVKGPCLTNRSPGATVVSLPRDGLLIVPAVGGSAEIFLRRFGPAFPGEPSARTVTPALLKASPDRSGKSWHARVVSTDRIGICGTSIGSRRLFGPPLPANGDQNCEPFNLGTRECRFHRYRPRQERP